MDPDQQKMNANTQPFAQHNYEFLILLLKFTDIHFPCPPNGTYRSKLTHEAYSYASCTYFIVNFLIFYKAMLPDLHLLYYQLGTQFVLRLLHR